MPCPLIDCYVLAPQRSADLARRFLDYFLPQREASFDPNDPIDVLGLPSGSSISDALDFLEQHANVGYSMYWRNTLDRAPYHAFLAFTSDGCLILGLSPCEDDRETEADRWVEEMKRFAAARHGFWRVEEAPPLNREEFQQRTSWA